MTKTEAKQSDARQKDASHPPRNPLEVKSAGSSMTVFRAPSAVASLAGALKLGGEEFRLTADQNNALANLEEAYLSQHRAILEHTIPALFEKQRAAELSYARNPTPEKLADLKAAKFDRGEATRTLRILKATASTFQSGAIRKFFSPLLEGAIARLDQLIKKTDLEERTTAEALKIGFQPSLNLESMWAVRQQARIRIECLTTAIGKSPMDIARELGLLPEEPRP
jgi:hypothetical protein